MRTRIKTPPFRGPDGRVLAGSIAEARYVRLGGLDQWVMIRGESRDNPALVVLHGGPGFSDTTFFRSCAAALEKWFTVVYWDQRGTGRSFYSTIDRASMTVAQFLSDLDELVDIVCARLGKKQVTILGHSWGSELGVLYADRFPQKVAAYVGVAQIGDAAASEAASYSMAVAEAERIGATSVLRRLRAIGPPPYDAKSVLIERTNVQRIHGELSPRVLWKTLRMLFAAPEASVVDVPDTLRGFQFSLDAMWAETSRLNLIEAVPKLQMPVVFMVGRRDYWVPAETSVAYFDALTAPSKMLVWFEHSGHEPFVDEASKFTTTMVELVRPLALAARDGQRAAFPGDALVPAAKAEVTHHVDIDAPPERVWPWLVQMGRRRAGWYSWDLLDNGGVRSADRILPELQHIDVGDILPVKAKGPDGFAVLFVDAPRALVLGDPSLLPGGKRDPSKPSATWAFALEPIDGGRTRLTVRVRADYEPSVAASLLRPIVGVVHDVMERKQLRTLKQRIEARSLGS